MQDDLMNMFYQSTVDRNRYISAALYNISKEMLLRLRNKRNIIWIIFFGLGFYFSIYAFLAIVLILLFIVLYHYLDEVVNYIGVYNSLKSQQVSLIEVKYNNEYFQYSIPFSYDYTKDYWSNFNIGFHNRNIGNISLYDSLNKRYCLFFRTEGNEMEYNEFLRYLESKVKIKLS